MPNWDYLSKLVKWILSCLVFFALPFLLIAFGFGQRWKVQEKESIDRLFHRLDGILIVIRRREATDAYISALLTKLFDIAEKSNRPIKVLSAGIKVLKERFLGALRFTIVNDEGTAVPSLSDGTLPSHALSKLFQATQAIIDEDPVKIKNVNCLMFLSRKKAGVFISIVPMTWECSYMPTKSRNGRSWRSWINAPNS
ncbi:hypothetical protein HYY75_02890 [bacterium]|nr:hypothetical protein [bacterium]